MLTGCGVTMLPAQPFLSQVQLSAYNNNTQTYVLTETNTQIRQILGEDVLYYKGNATGVKEVWFTVSTGDFKYIMYVVDSYLFWESYAQKQGELLDKYLYRVAHALSPNMAYKIVSTDVETAYLIMYDPDDKLQKPQAVFTKEAVLALKLDLLQLRDGSLR